MPNATPAIPDENAPLRVLFFCGSVRQPSHTRALTEAVEKALIERGAFTTHWDLRGSPLPFANPDFHDDPRRHDDDRVRSLVAAADEADAFVLSSPIYHNSYSASLKNVLDHLAIRQFWYKPVGLMSHGGNRSTQAVDQLRIVTRGLLGIAIPTQVCTSDQDYRSSADGFVLESADIGQRTERFASELVLFAAEFRRIRLRILHRQAGSAR